MPTEDSDSPHFSRTGFVGPFGPLMQPVKTLVDFDTDLMFRQKCHEAGTDVATALRNYIYKVARGETYEELCFHAAKVRAQSLLLEGPIAVLSKKTGGAA